MALINGDHCSVLKNGSRVQTSSPSCLSMSASVWQWGFRGQPRASILQSIKERVSVWVFMYISVPMQCNGPILWSKVADTTAYYSVQIPLFEQKERNTALRKIIRFVRGLKIWGPLASRGQASISLMTPKLIEVTFEVRKKRAPERQQTGSSNEIRVLHSLQ